MAPGDGVCHFCRVGVERGRFGPLPYAASGTGRPVVVLAGLAPVTGVDSAWVVRGAVTSLRAIAGSRRIVVFNRRPGLPRGMTMSQLAGEQAAALHAGFDEPVDVVGVSTGGSIAQQLAAEHPEVVRRLVLGSTACRLGEPGRRLQAEVARGIRAGDVRAAAGAAAASSVPSYAAAPVRWIAGRLASRMIRSPADADDLATTIEAEGRLRPRRPAAHPRPHPDHRRHP